MNFNSPITVNMGNRISCRLYSDTRPHCLEISQLQKGLVLMIDDKEVIEEGVGFGVPIALYKDEPYFSSSAECAVQNEGKTKTLIKSFVMDTVSRKRFGKTICVNDGLYTLLHKGFHRVYVVKSLLTPFFNKLIELTKLLGMNTEFVKVKPRGVVTIKYEFHPDSIDVEASLSQLDKNGCKEVVVLNEQGASFLQKILRLQRINLDGWPDRSMGKCERQRSFLRQHWRRQYLFLSGKCAEPYFSGDGKKSAIGILGLA